MAGPRIEEFYLGEPDLEAYYTEFPYSAMAIQPRLPNSTKRARELEAHGYYRRPPPGGRRACFAMNSMDYLDETSIKATRRGVEIHITNGELEEIKESYRASQFKDAFWIAYDVAMHPHVVIAALRHLEARGELPETEVNS